MYRNWTPRDIPALKVVQFQYECVFWNLRFENSTYKGFYYWKLFIFFSLLAWNRTTKTQTWGGHVGRIIRQRHDASRFIFPLSPVCAIIENLNVTISKHIRGPSLPFAKMSFLKVRSVFSFYRCDESKWRFSRLLSDNCTHFFISEYIYKNFVCADLIIFLNKIGKKLNFSFFYRIYSKCYVFLFRFNWFF